LMNLIVVFWSRCMSSRFIGRLASPALLLAGCVMLFPAAGQTTSSSGERNQQVPVWKQQTVPLGKKIEYKRVGAAPLFLYLLEPSLPAAGPRPGIVFFHGGGWVSGNLGQFNPQAAYLAAQGMAVIQVDYRLLPNKGAEPPRICAEDAKSAMRWVRAHAKELNIDPDRIAAGGGSAGGFLAAFTALVPSWNDPSDDLHISPRPNALVLMFPVIDISPAGYADVNKRFGPTYKEYAPEEFVSASAPPMIIQSGLDDKQVSPDSLRLFQEKMKKVGGRCDLILYPGQKHGFANEAPYMTITLTAAAHFLKSIGYLPASSPDPDGAAASNPH
jgi:acetyl esterase